MRNRNSLKWFWLLLVLCLCAMSVEAAAQTFTVFVGTYTGKQSKGIYSFRFNASNGKVTAPELAAETENPSFLAKSYRKKFLYAVNEVSNRGKGDEGGVTVFAVDGDKLKQVQEITSLGADPAYVTIDNFARFLLVANYTGGNVAVFPIGKDGKLGPKSAFDQHKGSSVNKERQAGPHAHSIQLSLDERIALSADLGLDEVLAYEFSPKHGTLTPAKVPYVKVAPGAGPRHVAFAPNNRFVYVTNEMASTVTVMAFNAKTGEMREVQTVPTLPADSTVVDNSTAEIQVDWHGANLYVSNRGEDTIVHFAIDPINGKLTFMNRTPTGGKTPRFFTLDPTGKWLFAANQESNDIFLFKVDAKSGDLTPFGAKIEVGAPVSLEFVRR